MNPASQNIFLCWTHSAILCANAAEELVLLVLGQPAAFLSIGRGQAALAAEVLHGSFCIWSQDDVLRPKYYPERMKESNFVHPRHYILRLFVDKTRQCVWNSLLAGNAHLCGSFGSGQMCLQADGGAEERWRALPLERSLPFHQVFPAVGAEHVLR